MLQTMQSRKEEKEKQLEQETTVRVLDRMPLCGIPVIVH